jgi:hypothetical protein
MGPGRHGRHETGPLQDPQGATPPRRRHQAPSRRQAPARLRLRHPLGCQRRRTPRPCRHAERPSPGSRRRVIDGGPPGQGFGKASRAGVFPPPRRACPTPSARPARRPARHARRPDGAAPCCTPTPAPGAAGCGFPSHSAQSLDPLPAIVQKCCDFRPQLHTPNSAVCRMSRPGGGRGRESRPRSPFPPPPPAPTPAPAPAPAPAPCPLPGPPPPAQPATRNPQPATRNPQPATRNPPFQPLRAPHKLLPPN